METGEHTAGTAQAPHGGGFPPFDTKTFPGQFVWLAITFAFLFAILWRIAGPRIAGAIATRKGRIAGDLAEAEKHRQDAQAASAAYDAALAGARKRAQAVAEENRKRIHAEIDKAKEAAEADAQATTAKAEARIRATRQGALAQVAKTAEEAAIAIVAHLTGETVSSPEAAAVIAARAVN
ncbi:MAG: ATP F0F1 synthase subunit B [Rhizomicrobium sp.]